MEASILFARKVFSSCQCKYLRHTQFMFFSKQLVDYPSNIDTDPLKCDRWIASSLLQKSIRRGDAELAQRAAFRLLELDKTAIWCRLIVITFEDVGAGDLDALLEAVFVASSSAWRRGCGEAAALGLATRRLAEAIKERSGDYLICAAKDHFDLSETSAICRKASLEQRFELLADTSQPLSKRAVAAW